jgi:hypothetical protein
MQRNKMRNMSAIIMKHLNLNPNMDYGVFTLDMKPLELGAIMHRNERNLKTLKLTLLTVKIRISLSLW